jgi:hypothetical protein
MDNPFDRPMTEALLRYRERVGYLVDLAVEDGPDPKPPGHWADVIAKEAAYLIEEGPDAYLRYVARLDDAAVRVDLNHHLRLITEVNF